MAKLKKGGLMMVVLEQLLIINYGTCYEERDCEYDTIEIAYQSREIN